MTMPRNSALNFIDEMPPRLWEKVYADPNCGCWLWAGAWSNGYGSTSIGGRKGRSMGVHRIFYEILIGPIPNGLHLDHLCRVRNCVNPDHLEPVTNAENARRGDAGKRTGELNRSKTHCVRGHPYAGENLYIAKDGARVCRTCKVAWTQRWRAMLKQSRIDVLVTGSKRRAA